MRPPRSDPDVYYYSALYRLQEPGTVVQITQEMVERFGPQHFLEIQEGINRAQQSYFAAKLLAAPHVETLFAPVPKTAGGVLGLPATATGEARAEVRFEWPDPTAADPNRQGGYTWRGVVPLGASLEEIYAKARNEVPLYWTPPGAGYTTDNPRLIGLEA